MVPLFGVLIEHQVTTHDVGVVTGKLCFDKGLCNVLPVFCNEHQAGHRCTDIFCDFKIVGEHSVAEQLTADPVWCVAGNIQQILQLIRLHLMLDHNTSRIFAEEFTAALRRSQHLRGNLRQLFNRALSPPLRVRGERERRHIDSHNAAQLVFAELLHVAPCVKVARAPANQDNIFETQCINQTCYIAAVSQVVVAIHGFGRIALAARIDSNDTILRGEILQLVLENLTREGQAGNEDQRFTFAMRKPPNKTYKSNWLV